MATFSMTVLDNPIRTDLPFVLSNDVDDCEQTMVITVQVPPGESRYVTLTHVGVGTNPANDVAETINTTTNYSLVQTGVINADPALNTNYATVTLVVRLVNGGSVIYSKQTNRTHDGNFC